MGLAAQRRCSLFEASDTQLEIVQPNIDSVQAPYNLIEPMVHIVDPYCDQNRKHDRQSSLNERGLKIAGFIS